MYFRTFTQGVNTEKLIEKAGFSVNSFHEVKSYCGIIAESITNVPKDYLYDGSLWEPFDITDFSERFILLCRIPIPLFTDLWSLYLNGNKEDCFGALIVIAKKYEDELISAIESKEKNQRNERAYKKKLYKLKMSPVIRNCQKSNLIISAIDLVLKEE